MKVAITGANGFIGRELTQKLTQEDYQVITLTRQPLPLDKTDNLLIANYATPDFDTKLQGVDCIIHLAAKTHSGTKSTAKNLHEYRQTNLINSISLAKAAIRIKTKRFIYLSSIKVNGEETKEQPYSVHDIPQPQDAYGISKWETEQALQDLFKDTNVELTIVRPPLVWSRDNLKGNLKLLKKWSDLGLPLPLKGINNKRDLISIDNLCSFLSLCIKHPNASGQTFLVSDGFSRNSLDIALLAGPCKTISLPYWFLKVMTHTGIGKKLFGNLQIDITHTITTTGWRPTNTY
jgi:nucleoside-diphosphate-sugar epimerase